MHSIKSETDGIASGTLRLMRQNGVAPAALGFQRPNVIVSASLETIRRCCGEDCRDKITKTRTPETKGHVNKHFKPDALAEVAAITQEKVLDNGNGHRASKNYLYHGATIGIAPHLYYMGNVSKNKQSSSLIISRWRVGSAAIGSTID
jgi:hypothetical protein